MLYGRVATGYRPGGPNVIVPNVPPSVDADRMTNYEIGLKADLADRMVSVDAAFFWLDWTDIQVTRAFGCVSGCAHGGQGESETGGPAEGERGSREGYNWVGQV